MAQMLLINPAKRAKRRATAKRRKAPSAAQRANWARFAAMARGKSKARRAANPIARKARRKVRRAAVSVYRSARRVTRRRRNPIGARSMGGGLFNFRSYIGPIKDAAVMGAGAVAVDVAFGYINRYLPAMAQVQPGTVGVGDAVKAVLTVALGKLLAKPTRGLSQKAAMGSLVVQMRDVTMKVLPPSITGMAGVGAYTYGGTPLLNRVGFANPARVVPAINSRANANTRPQQIGSGGAMHLGVYTSGGTPLLSRAPARAR